MPSKTGFKDYYYLTKPGIIYGNLLMAAAGFLFACRWRINLSLLISALLGMGLVIGSACVFNNYIDRGIDQRMERTKQRALVSGKIGGLQALSYGAALGILGFALLAWRTNLTTLSLGLIGFIDYVVLYGLSKRRFAAGTLIGSISGAVPPAAGYTAVTGHFDITAFLLFLILVIWQMPHFYAISIYRYEDYKAAGLPVLPVAKNVEFTRRRIIAYIAALPVTLILLKIYGHAGYIYLLISLILCGIWLGKSLKTRHLMKDEAWARQVFGLSLLVLCGLSAAIAFGSLLP